MKKKELFWISSSKKDLSKFPETIQDEALFALDLARDGQSYKKVKSFKGFHGAAVMEIVLSGASGAFRVLYAAKFDRAIYVLHAFQKKSKKGIETPKHEVDLVHSRYQSASMDYKERYAEKKKNER